MSYMYYDGDVHGDDPATALAKTIAAVEAIKALGYEDTIWSLTITTDGDRLDDPRIDEALERVGWHYGT